MRSPSAVVRDGRREHDFERLTEQFRERCEMAAGQGIFLVGVPRSGTTLLAAMLASHSRLSCGPETHVFSHLGRLAEFALLHCRRWPQSAVGYLQTLHYHGDDVIRNYGLEPRQIHEYLAHRPRQMSFVLKSLTELYMQREGKARWVEKTPNHMARVARLRSLFPDAPVIRIVRDPRDVALSLLRMPWGPSTLLAGAALWKSYDDVSRSFFDRDRLCITVRYEDLVENPRAVLQRLCSFLGESFEPAMLDQRQAYRHLNRLDEPWKAGVAESVYRHRAGQWRQVLTSAENGRVEALVGDRLAALGYPVTQEFSCLGSYFPRDAGAVGLLERLPLEGVRFWRVDGDARAQWRVFLGDPAQWITRPGLRRYLRALRYCGQMLAARWGMQKIVWVAGPEYPRAGALGRLLRRLLARYRVAGCGRDEAGPLGTLREVAAAASSSASSALASSGSSDLATDAVR